MKGIFFPRRYVACILLLSLAAGCASSSSGRRAYGSSDARLASAPNWYAERFSWDKLQRIEDWLAGPGPGYWPNSTASAELELANGRLTLARRDRSTLSAGGLVARLNLAETGFRRVLGDDHADATDRSQAQAGLREAKSMRGAGTGMAGSATASTGAGAPVIRPRSAWRASPRVPAKVTRNTRPWTRITVHHSATSAAGLTAPSEVASADAIRLIQKNHMQSQGWGDIGYHFLIDPAGRVFQGRSLQFQGAHAGGVNGRNNVGNIGICLIGDFNTSYPDARAMRALEQLVGALSTRHHIPRSALYGHSDFKATECPGRHLLPWVKRYAR